MVDALTNFGYTTVTSPPAPATTGGSLVVANAAVLPATPPYNLTVWPSGAQPLTTNAEIIRVTAVSGNTLTITRQAEASAARGIVAGDQIAQTVTAGLLGQLGGLTKAQTQVIAAEMAGIYPNAVGQYVGSHQNITTTSAATPDQNRININHTVFSGPWTADAFRVQINTALVQGSGDYAFYGALYGSLDNGFIDVASGPVVQAQFATSLLTTTGQTVQQFAAPVVITPNRYWIVTLATWTTAPTTQPQFVCMQQGPGLPTGAGNNAGLNARSIGKTGQTSLPQAGAATWDLDTSVSPSINSQAPVLQLRRSA